MRADDPVPGIGLSYESTFDLFFMHFSKTFTQLLLELPPELRDNAIQYRQLKKLINQVVLELASFGLSPDVLHDLLASSKPADFTHAHITPHSDTTAAASGDATPDVDVTAKLHSEVELMSEGASSKVLGGEGPSSTLLTTSLSGGPGTQAQGPLIPNTPAAAAPVATTSVPVLGISPNLDCGPLDENGNATIVSSTSQSSPPSSPHDQQHHNLLPRVIYDFNSKSGKIEARLRLWLPGGAGRAQLLAPVLPTSTGSGNSQASSVASSSASDLTTEEDNERLMEEDDEKEENLRGNPLIGTSLAQTLRRALHVDHEQHHDLGETSEIGSLQTPGDVSEIQYREINIPLHSDSAFIQLLSSALEGLSMQLKCAHTQFKGELQELSRTISYTARPYSEVKRGGFQPFSGLTMHAGAIELRGGGSVESKSDLYSWREIFQLYVEAEVFESISEKDRGERTVEDSESRLGKFAERVMERGLGDKKKFKMKASRDALATFIHLNMFILDLKKFQFANSEAARKILKKHTKRTALPLIPLDSVAHADNMQILYASSSTVSPFSFSLPRIFVQAVGEILLPIIPHLDDYSCLICTSIAFKPIRLSCSHLFCVRCLVKMQKRGKGMCPMCRAESVLKADQSNVDWALVNFMQDWFPLEAREKLKENEKEASEEELREMGLDPDQACIIC